MSPSQGTDRKTRRESLRARHFPESTIDNFSRIDGAVEFYTRVNALVEPDMVIVDFGAGRGHWISDSTSSTRRDLRNFRGRVSKVIGIDIDPAAESNPSLDEAHVIDPSPASLPLEDSSVDLVISDFTFEHISNPEVIARELHRVLKPGGWICARTPNKYGYIGFGARIVPNERHASWLKRLQPARKEVDIFPVEYRMNTRRQLDQLFPSDRFRRIVYTYHGEPAYAGASRVLWTAFGILRRVQPRALDPMLHIFIQKAADR